MKKHNIVKLSCINLFDNFTRSILSIITLVLLSSIIILMCNFCFYFKKTTDANILYNINKHGTIINFSIKKDAHNNPMLKKIEIKDINEFIKKAEEWNLMQYYFLEYNEISGDVNLSPFIDNYDDIKVIIGEKLSSQDKYKNSIWLSEEYSIQENILLNDTVEITINGVLYNFIVKGIVDSVYSYIDYSYFDITKITVLNDKINYSDYSIIKKILFLQKTAPNNTLINEESVFYSAYYFVLGASIFLTLFCVLFSLGSVLNILKISIEDNHYSIGIMKSLGMKNKDLMLYIVTQIFIIIIISTVCSTFFSWIVNIFTIDRQISTISRIFAYEQSVISSGFNVFLPLLNFIILVSVVLLGSLTMLKRYTKQDVQEIMRGDI